MQVADPLCAIAHAAQHRHDDGGAPSLLHQRFLGKGAARPVCRCIQAALIAHEDRIGKAQLPVGRCNVVFAARFPLQPVEVIAAVGIAACRHKAQRGQRQPMVILQRRVLKKGVGIVKVMGQICLAVVAAEGHGIPVFRHDAAHHGLCFFRQQSVCRRVGCQCSCRQQRGSPFYRNLFVSWSFLKRPGPDG